MKITETEFPGLFIIEPIVHHDERGYFFEAYRQDLFEEKIGKVNFVQENESYSNKGTLRGLHYQLPPYAQGKLVRVISGSVLDVAVDIRKSSPTFGKYFSIELTDANKLQLWIPRGFAHGFIALTENVILAYKVDSLYNKSSEAGIIYDDQKLNINWSIEIIDVSAKDKSLPYFEHSLMFD